MTRQEFLRISSLLGLYLPVLPSMTACSNIKNGSSFEGKVLILGAGPAGMTAGYLLAQQGIDFQLLEATASYGGRVACSTSIADFPTPLGAEWVHSAENIFGEIVNDVSVDTSSPQLVGYQQNDLQDTYGEGILHSDRLGKEGVGNDRKFINSCWQEFFGKYIIPSIADKILYDTPASAIEYAGEKVVVTAGEKSYQADKCIITVPLKILQTGGIEFSPELPKAKQKAMSKLEVMPGFKCFLKTSQKFYNTYLLFEDTFLGGGQWIYYDAAYGQNTLDNILGFLCVGPKAAAYPYQDSEKLLAHITAELEGIYGADNVEILDFVYTNWDELPFTQGTYLGIEADPSAIAAMAAPVGDKLYFAGSAYTKQTQKGRSSIWGISENWSNVHAATRAAARAVKEVLEG